LSPEIFRAYDWLQQVGFPQINIDLIAGMMGESDENWARCVEKAGELEPDNITIYQMELPHNTLIANEMKSRASPRRSRVGWSSGAGSARRWTRSARRDIRSPAATSWFGNLDTDHFVYRDHLFRGSDVLATAFPRSATSRAFITRTSIRSSSTPREWPPATCPFTGRSFPRRTKS